jgi:rhodanese-related sulfurtransferase
MKIITISELHKEMLENAKNIIIINVLPEKEYNDCHIPQSINIPLADLASKISSIDRNKKIIVHCAHQNCLASTRAYDILQTAGFTNLYDYKGGMREWAQSNLEKAGVCELSYLHELDQKK